MFINLIGNKMKALIVGGGRAAYIKINKLLKDDVNILCVSKSFIREIKNIKDKNLSLQNGVFSKELLKDKHIVIIAVDDDAIIRDISQICEKESIIYVNCKIPEDGMAIMPSEGQLNNLSFAVNTKGKNPRGSIFIRDVIREELKDYDNFISDITKIRNILKNHEEKDYIMEFLSSKDFKYFYDKGKERLVLSLFFSKKTMDVLFK